MTTALLSEVGRREVVAGSTLSPVPLTAEEIGTRIVAARESKKPKPWSQFDLAIALGVSPSTIYRWEKGRLPSMNELLRLTEVLEVPPDYLTDPPERRAEVADLADRLAELLTEIGRSRDAVVASLVAIATRLQRIEAQLGIPDARDSDTAP